jgi:hypothetical protein
MSVVVTNEVTVEDLDEAMKHLQLLLADDRLKPLRRNLLLETLDDLLDERIKLAKEGNNTKVISGGIHECRRSTSNQSKAIRE